MGFNADDHPYENPFAPLPKGKYEVRVDAFESRLTQANDEALNFTLVVLGPTHVNRKLWVRFIPRHKANPEFAKKECGRLSEFSRAVGVPRWEREDELIGRTCVARVGIDRQDEERNEVYGFVVDKELRGVPVHNPARDEFRSDEGGRPGSLAKQTVAASQAARARAPIPATQDMPAYFDDDVPF